MNTVMIPGQPPASTALKAALEQLASGNADAAEETVRAAAVKAKSESGSGSLPLARAYADMARLHFQKGDYKKAATEFKHASEGPMPPDAPGRKDRLAAAIADDGPFEARSRNAERTSNLRSDALR